MEDRFKICCNEGGKLFSCEIHHSFADIGPRVVYLLSNETKPIDLLVHLLMHASAPTKLDENKFKDSCVNCQQRCQVNYQEELGYQTTCIS